jgi:thiamine biosynthesis lipoprotein
MELVHVRLDQNHMATTFEFTVSCERARAAQAERALAEGHRRVSQLELELSEFLAISPIHRLNQAAPGEPVPMPVSALELFEKASFLRRMTAGSFDFLAKSGPCPQASPAARLMWDRERHVAWRTDEAAHVSFGAIGKGYALDHVRAHLDALGFTDYLLSAGGSSLIIAGFAGPGDPWTFGWSWSRDAEGAALGAPFAHVSGKPIAIGVSGTHEKGAHLIDPRSSEAVDPAKGARSMLIAHPLAADADALSTALFVSGWERGQELLESFPATPPAAASIDADGVPVWNGAFQRLWNVPAQWLGLLALAFVQLQLWSAGAIAVAPTGALADEGAIDLGALGGSADTFTPYLQERNSAWALLPILSIGLVLLHLKKYKAPSRKKNQNLVQISKL